MLQIELYVADLDKSAKLFTSVFGLAVAENKPGFRLLHHKDNFDIMLFTPGVDRDATAHWPLPKNGSGGSGIEIVLRVADAAVAREAVGKHGVHPSDVRPTPWGTLEFTFRMKEGYLIRVKQA